MEGKGTGRKKGIRKETERGKKIGGDERLRLEAEDPPASGVDREGSGWGFSHKGMGQTITHAILYFGCANICPFTIDGHLSCFRFLLTQIKLLYMSVHIFFL